MNEIPFQVATDHTKNICSSLALFEYPDQAQTIRLDFHRQVDMAETPKLQSTGISVDYFQARLGKTVRALSKIDLAINENQFVSIVGPSGCGKTTFLNVVAGVIVPSEGELFLDGRPVEGPGGDRAVVFQQASLLPWRTVLGNILFGLECQGKDTTSALFRASELLEIVGLTGFEDHYPHELSGACSSA